MATSRAEPCKEISNNQKSKVMGNTTKKTSTEVMTNALSTYDKCKILPSELLQQRDELLAQLKASNKLICSLKLSMLAHPDCEDGSEFDDFTGNAQALENTNEYLIQKIENHV